MSEETAVDVVRLEVDKGVGTIRLDRPPMNAIDRNCAELLRGAAEACATRRDVRSVVLYGGERAFAAGADVKAMATLGYAGIVEWIETLTTAFEAVARIPKPVVAAVTGYALGGGLELALCADFRVFAEDAKVGVPEILLGVVPGAGGTQRLPRLVGPSKAKDMIFTGRQVRSPEALRIGLADRVVPAETVYAEASALARRFVDGPALALRAAKRAVDDGMELDLTDGLRLENALFTALFGTEDQKIGMESFLTKGPGKASFEGR